MSTDELAVHASLIDHMGELLRDEAHAFSTGPKLLRRILEDGAWREFRTKRGELVTPASFAEFVITKPLKGLGATVGLVRRVAAEDTQTLDLLDRELKSPHGGNHSKSDNITLDNNRRGTSTEGALRRLRKDRPDLHADVLAERISPHAAMVQAGFRPQTVTIRTDDMTAIARTLRRRLTAQQLAELGTLLADSEAHGDH